MKYKYIQRTTVAGRVYMPGDPVGGELSEKELAKFLDVGHVAEKKEAKPKKKKAGPKKRKPNLSDEVEVDAGLIPKIKKVSNGNGPDA